MPGWRTFAAADRSLVMKVLRLAVRLILSGLLLLGLIAGISFASFQAGFKARCKEGNNVGGPFTQDNILAQHVTGFDWAGRALTCSMGDFQFVTPSKSGHRGDDLFIIRKGRPFLMVSEKETDLLDDSGKHFLFALQSATSERVSVITYSAYDQTKGAWIENFDFGSDGTLDYRKTEVNGRKVKEEFRVGDHWLERVQQDGRTGVVFNGQFMPVADAIKLGAKSKADDK
jgi:hypothetical protein